MSSVSHHLARHEEFRRLQAAFFSELVNRLRSLCMPVPTCLRDFQGGMQAGTACDCRCLNSGTNPKLGVVTDTVDRNIM